MPETLRRRTWAAVCLCVVCAVVACEPPVARTDGGAALDAGALADAGLGVDAGGADAGVPDAGALDAGALDAGALDAGRADGGASDAGASDAGASDAGATDAGSADAGAGDAGPRDAGGSAGCGVAVPLSPGDRTSTLVIDGGTRSYIVHVPTGYSGRTPLPVVLDFHPLGVSAATWKAGTDWAQAADREGFLAVWPQGVGDSWNVGRCCDPALASAVDDVAFTRAILAALQAEACVDPRRVYATGCSNGGGMSYRLACDAADVIAAVAPVDFDCLTGATNTPSCGRCMPSRPISTCQFRGVLDPLVPYGGGPTTVVPGISFPGAQANFMTWGGFNACTGTPQPVPSKTACTTYPACASGVETTLCTIPLGTHCVDYRSFGIVDVAWASFARQRLP